MSTNLENDIIIELRKRLCSSDHEFFGYENYGRRIISPVQNSYKQGGSNSLLIIGKKESGKTHLIKNILQELNQDTNFCKNMYTVHLNGSIHTSSKIALRSIASQLKCQLVNEEEETDFENDSSLFGRHFNNILSALKSGRRNCVSLLFIVEEFDRFLQHKNQILIYYLLNSDQSSGTSIFVLGTTRATDVFELMEKRVKSRFSQHKIHLIPFASTFNLYIDAARHLLTVSGNSKSAQAWNKSVSDFFKDSQVLKYFEQNFLICNSIAGLKKFLTLPVAKLNKSNLKLCLSDVEDSWQLLSMDYQAEILKNLSQLEITLLATMVICSTRCTDDMNFEIIYKEFQSFCQQSHTAVSNKTLLVKCLNNLIDLGLAEMKKEANSSSNFHTVRCFVTQKDLLECIKNKSVPTRLQNYINIVLRV